MGLRVGGSRTGRIGLVRLWRRGAKAWGELFAMASDSWLVYGGRGVLRPYQGKPGVREREPEVMFTSTPRKSARAKERCRAEAPPRRAGRRYESKIEGNSDRQRRTATTNGNNERRQRTATTLPICHWKPGENRRHGGVNCVILRLRLIPRLCCAVPLVE